MRARAGFLAITTLVVVALLAPSVPAGGQEPGDVAFADLFDSNGELVGSGFFFADGDRVFVELFVLGMTPGFHGLHLHETGLCQAPFTSAGGHHNPDAGTHGDHDGDLASVVVDGDGTGLVSLETDRFTVAELLAGDGSALVIHAGRDNFANVPARYQSTQVPGPGPDLTTLATGDTGYRLACGVVDADDGPQARAARDAAHRRTTAARRPAAARGSAAEERAASEPVAAEAILRDATGTEVGVVRFAANSDIGILDVGVTARGLTPGFHGFHVHQTGTCAAPFSSAGGHHNPSAADHGDHDGDLAPLDVKADGRVSTQLFTDRTDLSALLGGDGSAVIIHAGRDNFANIPDRYQSSLSASPGPDAETLATGDSGTRVACGVVEALTPTELYVDAVYTVVLGRRADRAGRDYWSSYLDGGGRRGVFTAALLGSSELIELYIGGYYGLYLDRAPDRGALRHWKAYLGQPGSRLALLEASLLGSTEFFELVGGTNRAFVDDVYPLLLERNVDASARRYWLAQLDRGVSRRRVVGELLHSAEVTRLRAAEAYFLTLGRDPDRAGLRYWAGFLARGGDQRALYASLTASDEFYATATSGGSPFVVVAGRARESKPLLP